MNLDSLYDLMKYCLTEGMILISPFVLSALVVGVLVSLFQTITSIQEQTLSFVPKLFTAALMMWFLGPWMLRRLGTLMTELIQRAGTM
jgi:flagellar biosynthetic protein FliQ